MRPLFLHLKNIGPFRDESIDFTQLDDMFLISGMTGSGKTTILDAMTYALYGEFSGSKSKTKVHIHSDFAPSEEEGFVEFIFILNQTKYKIIRSVSVEHVSKSGKTTSTAVKMELCAFDPKTNDWISSQGKPTELTEKVKNLTGLSKDEFSQIVILPQGEFSKFLKEEPRARSETLSKLFPVEIYKNICEKAKADADEAKQSIDFTQQSLSQEMEKFETQGGDDRLQNLTEELSKAEAELSNLEKQKQSQMLDFERIKNDLEKAKESSALAKKKEELEKQAPSIASLEKDIDKIEKALLLEEKLNSKKRTQKQLEDTCQKISELQIFLQTSKANLSILQSKKRENEANRNKEWQIEIEIKQIDDKLTKLQRALTIKESFESAKANILELFTKTAPAMIKADKEIETVETQIERNKFLFAKADYEIQMIKTELEEQKTNQAAAFLASHLEDNKPCPVCGSLTHPNPHQFHTSSISRENQIDIFEKSKRQIEKENIRLENMRDELKESYTKFKQMVDQIDETAQKYNVPLPRLETLPLRQDPLPTGIHIDAQFKLIRETITALVKNSASFETLQEDGFEDVNILRQRQISLQKQSEQILSECEAFEKQLQNEEKNVTATNAQILTLESARQNLENEYRILNQELAQSMEKSPFKQEEDIENILVNKNQLDSMKNQCETYHSEITRTNAKLEECKVKPEDTQRLEQLNIEAQNRLEETEKFCSEVKNTSKALLEQKASLSDSKQRIEKLQKEQNELTTKFESLLALSSDINGQNPKKTSLDAWVLGTFLDEVIVSANVNFAKISSNRYTFILKTEGTSNGKKGLDLIVRDSHTGLCRNAESLSGGETFMASLSLALALTDVVQQKSGGIRLDSLFVDEGFGSLDSVALYNAIQTLEEIREHRIVGIISHVESLNKAIPSHIELTKTTQGSTISIV